MFPKNTLNKIPKTAIGCLGGPENILVDCKIERERERERERESKIFTKLYIFFDNHFTCKPNTGNHFPEHNQTIENSFVPKNILT